METNQTNNVLLYCDHCRICLQIHQQMTPIQSLKELIDFNMLLTFFNVEVMADIRYPNKICIICLNQLRNIVLFKQKCESSFNYLKNILNDDGFQTGNLFDNDKSIKIEYSEDNDFDQDNTDEKCQGGATEEVYRATVNNDVKTEEPDTTLFSCNKCKSTSETCSCINSHIKSEDDAGETKENSKKSSKNKSRNRFKCKHCEKTFMKPSHQLRHEATHEKQFKCDRCEESFSSEKFLTRHIRIHVGLKPFPCNQCSRSYTRNSSLTFHKKLHHSDKPPPRVTCQKCGASVVHIAAHDSFKHGGDSGHKIECQYCEKKFTCKASLRYHMSIFHEKCAEPFKVLCTLCGKKFRRAVDLDYHNKTNHSDERNYPCRHCDKRFKTSSARCAHEKSHLNDRRFKCIYCQKAFNKKDILESHVLIHTGEKPFSCSICSKAFRQDGTLRNHIKLVHGRALIK